MKAFLYIFLLVTYSFCNAQSVTFSRMEKIHDNKDKFLYKISDTVDATYLGTLEIGGFTNDDALMFSNIYKNAKKVGANSYAFKPILQVDGSAQEFDPNHYFLNLYYIPEEKIQSNSDEAYIMGSAEKSQTIGINKDKLVLPARSFRELKLTPGEVYTISTLKFLGSTIKFSAQKEQKSNYFQVLGAKIKSNPLVNPNNPGINIKSGDIIRLDPSYGMFLTLIYKKVE